jgi:hypothetical protein
MKTNTTPIYPSPPNSPPQTKLSIPEARIESEEEFCSPNVVAGVPLSPPTSPPQNSSNSMRSERPVEKRSWMNASTLKTSLGLGDWQCGCDKGGNKGICRKPIGKERRKLINSHVESMTTLTPSSPELEAELDKLFSLVHCHFHGQQKSARLEKWKVDFPVGDADTKRVVSTEKQIKEALGQLSNLCIWGMLEGELCLKSIGGQRVQNCANTIDKIVKPQVFLEDAHLDYLLEVLETNMYCPGHIGKIQFKKVALWKSKVIEIRKPTNSELIQPIKRDVLDGFASQTGIPNTPEAGSLSTEKSNNLVSHGRGLLTQRNLPLLSKEFNQDRAKFWPEANDTSPFHITARVNDLADYNRVLQKLEQPLTGRDLEDGYVYLYKVKRNERFVKIGWTARTVKLRHEE